MPNETFKRAHRRMLRGRIGDTATLTNYTDVTDASGDVVYDDHGDPERTQDTQVSGVPALFREPDQEFDQDSMGGVDTAFDATVFVPSDEDVREPGGADGTGGKYRHGTRITDETSGDAYDVVAAWDEKNGMYRCAVKEV